MDFEANSFPKDDVFEEPIIKSRLSASLPLSNSILQPSGSLSILNSLPRLLLVNDEEFLL